MTFDPTQGPESEPKSHDDPDLLRRRELEDTEWVGYVASQQRRHLATQAVDSAGRQAIVSNVTMEILNDRLNALESLAADLEALDDVHVAAHHSPLPWIKLIIEDRLIGPEILS